MKISQNNLDYLVHINLNEICTSSNNFDCKAPEQSEKAVGGHRPERNLEAVSLMKTRPGEALWEQQFAEIAPNTNCASKKTLFTAKTTNDSHVE